jgi:hypothetical protein
MFDAPKLYSSIIFWNSCRNRSILPRATFESVRMRLTTVGLVRLVPLVDYEENTDSTSESMMEESVGHARIISGHRRR